MRKITACIAILVALVSSAAHAQLREALSVRSPQGDVEIKVLPGDSRLTFTVIANGVAVIEPSPMSFTLDGVDLADGATYVGRENYAVNEEYPTRGVHARGVNYCNGTRFLLKHAASGQEFTVDLRAYRDGAAFRIIVPAAAGATDQHRVPDETTTFTLPADATIWSHNLRGHYEGDYEKRDIAAIEAGTWHAPPVTFKLAGGAYGIITEANLVNYSGMALEADGKRGFRVGLGHRQPVSHPYELRYSKEDVARLSRPAAISGTITTPWRVVILAKDLNALVNCDLVTNLNPPPDKKLFPDGQFTAWVLPGRAVWRYLDNDPPPAPDARGTTQPTTRPAPAAPEGAPQPPAAVLQALPEGAVLMTRTGDAVTLAQAPTPADAGARADVAAQPRQQRGPTTATTTSTGPTSRPRTTAKDMKVWSDLAEKLGFEYSILEGFWSRWTPEELSELVASSRLSRVGIWVWVHSRNLRTPEDRQAMFKRCVDAGVVGLKVDFFDHEHKETIDQYHAILKEAAEHKLLLNFHGANKPAGESRTWPNELVREAVRGMEARKLLHRAAHETTLPFTRYVVGHAEYTGTLFSDRRGDTTFAHQIAIPVVLTAPLLTYGAHPQRLIASPAADVIRQIPPVWDETIVLPPSEIGEIAVFARRLENRWFLGVLNGQAPRQIQVPLTFLKQGKYTATLVRDGGSDPTSMKVEKDQVLRPADTVTIDLAAGGGFVGCFVSKEE